MNSSTTRRAAAPARPLQRHNLVETSKAFALSTEDRATLRALLANQPSSAGHARRIRVVLLAGQGVPGVEIARRLELSVGQVSRIRQRFMLRGVAGLADSPHLGRHDHAVSAQTVARVITLAVSPPPPGRKRWSTRLIAAHVGLSSATIAKILRKVPGRPASAHTPGVARPGEPGEGTR